MKRLLLTLGLALAMTGVMSAAPLCSTLVGSNVTTIGSCQIGSLIFDNFVVINNGGFTSVNINIGAATGPSGINNDLALAVNVSPPIAGPGGGDIIVQYRVTGANQTGASIQIGTANQVAITELICTNPLAGTTCTAPPATSYTMVVNQPVPPGQSTSSVTFGSPLSVTYIQKDIAFGNGGSISDFINSHQAVPEPTTSLLMGTALLGLALLRKRFGQK